MKIVINDANVFIDLIHIELIDVFIASDIFEIKTTDFVYEEVIPEQKDLLEEFVRQEKLQIIKSDENDLSEIFQLMENNKGLSIPDCSVWYFAKKYEGILLTGDGKLRKSSQNKVEVRGILYIFDQLLISDKINFDQAIEKIQLLYQCNARLPKKELDLRLQCWRQKRCTQN